MDAVALKTSLVKPCPAKIKPKSGRFKPKKWQRHRPMPGPAGVARSENVALPLPLPLLSTLNPPISQRRLAGRPQGPLKIKTPSQNVRKIGKPKQGKASVFAPPTGGPCFIPLIQRPGNAKTFISAILAMFHWFNLCRF
jgi:hypothetical protein